MTDFFALAIQRIQEIHARKGADYAESADEFSNFRGVARRLPLRPYEVADMLEDLKMERLFSLRSNGTTPQNESVADTYLDKAVYALIAYAMYLEATVNAETP